MYMYICIYVYMEHCPDIVAMSFSRCETHVSASLITLSNPPKLQVRNTLVSSPTWS